jgi:hypothetical protein
MLKKLSISLLCLATTTAVFRAADLEAKPNFPGVWKALYPGACTELTAAADNCTLCHTWPSVVYNAYGQAYRDNGKNWVAIENMDSDGDGRTNIQEINQDCSFPGDITSPNETNSWAAIKALYEG